MSQSQEQSHAMDMSAPAAAAAATEPKKASVKAKSKPKDKKDKKDKKEKKTTEEKETKAPKKAKDTDAKKDANTTKAKAKTTTTTNKKKNEDKAAKPTIVKKAATVAKKRDLVTKPPTSAAPIEAAVFVQGAKVDKPATAARRARGPLRGTKHSRQMVRKLQVNADQHIFNNHFLGEQVRVYMGRHANGDTRGSIRLKPTAVGYLNGLLTEHLTHVAATADRLRQLAKVGKLTDQHVLTSFELTLRGVY